MAIENEGLLRWPNNADMGPRRPEESRYCRFHREYGHTTEECTHLANEIERLIKLRPCRQYADVERKTRGKEPYRERESASSAIPPPAENNRAQKLPPPP